MREAIRLAVTAVLMVFVVGSVVVADTPEQDRALAIGSRIRCPVCQGEPIADSPSDYARDMMSLVRERIDEGYSDDQIEDELLASFSGSQLLDPPMTASTIALWVVPLVVLVGGTWVMVTRRRPDAATQNEAEVSS